jgi:hypothetical protein
MIKVDRHLKGETHRLAVQIEDRYSEDPGSSRVTNLDIENSVTQDNRDALSKMLRTAYEMALKPSMPHSHFETLIKCQRMNGVILLEGKCNNKAGY